MDQVATNITNLCSAVQPYGYIMAIVSVLVLGVMFGFPSDKSHEKAKQIAPWIVIGMILFIGATSIGKWLGDQITFTGAGK